MVICDSHCHISCQPKSEDAQRLINSLEGMAFQKYNIMSTNPWDLDFLLSLKGMDHQNLVIPYLGIHPWYSHLFSFTTITKEEHYTAVLSEVTLELLEVLPEPVLVDKHLQKIEKFASSLKESGQLLGIGEIGLDKLFRVPNSGYFGSNHRQEPKLTKSKVRIEHQMAIFKVQLELAERIRVPVSLHCVKAHGPLYDVIRDHSKQCPHLILHSYSGSLHQAQRWIKDFKKQNRKLSFSFSKFVNGKPEKIGDFNALLDALDDLQILVETDYPLDEYILNGKQDEYSMAMESIQTTIGEFKGWSPEFSRHVLNMNSENIYTAH